MYTFLTPLTRARAVAGASTAVVCGTERLSYAATWERCARLIAGLQRAGCRPGDRIAVVAANCHRYLELYQAVPAGGWVLVPLHTRHTTAELAYALRDAGVRVLVTDRAPGELAALVDQVLLLPDDYEALLAESPPLAPPDSATEDDLAGLFYTGGTTGAAKGVMLTHRNLLANSMHMLACARLSAADRWLVMAPMFHAAGSIAVLATVWLGAAHVVLPTFDPAAALDLVETEGVTATLGVPTMVAALAAEQLARPREVASLRLLSHGGAPIATEVLRRAHLAFPGAELLHLYGATETAPIATAFPHEERFLDAPQARSCGQPALGVEVAVLDAAGAAVPAGTVGEVVIRGPNVMRGYWNKPAETAAVLPAGWYHSGDLGYLDEAGFLYLVDRARDVIVTGGENVYSTEVEEVLFAHPMVAEAAVFGIPHPVWGEAVHAVVVPRGPVTAPELLAHCKPRLADYKIPKQVELRADPLPKSGAGKVLKRELRDAYWTGHDRRIG